MDLLSVQGLVQDETIYLRDGVILQRRSADAETAERTTTPTDKVGI